MSSSPKNRREPGLFTNEAALRLHVGADYGQSVSALLVFAVAVYSMAGGLSCELKEGSLMLLRGEACNVAWPWARAWPWH